MKFKKGDIIIGNEKNYYGITSRGVKCTVCSDENKDGLIVVVLGIRKELGNIDYMDKFTVEAKKFNLIKKKGIQFK